MFLIFGRANIAPCQPITKPRCKNSIKHIRFCRFANCLSAYSPCVPVGVAHENCVFCWHSGVSGWVCFYKNKNHQKVVLIFGSPNIAPRYTINKIKKISLGRFFKIFLIVYSRIRHAQLGLLWRIRLGRFSKIKKSGKTRFVYFGSPNIAP